MSEKIIKEAPTVEEALEDIADELGVPQSEIEYEVIQEPGKKLFGMGGDKVARVEGWLSSDAGTVEGVAIAREILEIEDDPADTDETEAALSDSELCQDDSEEYLAVSTPSSAETEISEEAPFGGTAFGDFRAAASDRGDEEEFTDEQLDAVADAGVEALREILPYFGKDPDTISIEEYEGEEGEIILDIVGGDLAILIGRHGRTLEALQIVVALIAMRKVGFRYPLVIDVEGYKNRRRQKIESIARSAASRSVRQGSPVHLKAMTPYERRLVHVTLKEDTRVITQSEGEDPNRVVIVKPRR